MLEDPGTVLRDLTLENPIRAIREISHDLTCRRKVRLANGREVSALDIQSEYLNRALRYRDTHGLSPQEDRALDMWEHCLKALESDPLTLGRECDWVAKHQLIEAYRERHGLAARAPQGGAARPAVPRREPGPRALLPDGGPRPGGPAGATTAPSPRP